MRERTPTRDELVHCLGEGIVVSLEALRGMGGLDLLDRIFVCAHGAAEEYVTHAELGEAYLRARAAGTCPCHGLSDFYWNHRDVDGPCGIFPCPECAEENVHAGLMGSLEADDRDAGDDDIPF